jgi:hypothetical protein
MYRCCHRECPSDGNGVDLWVAVQYLPIREAALNLTQMFGVNLSHPFHFTVNGHK